MVSHDAKECSVWLSSKGSLPLNQQGYGAWLQVDPFSAGKKSFVFIPGTRGDFGGEDNPIRTSGGSERRSRRTEAPQEVNANLVDPNSSTDDQNTATPDNQATITPNSHAGNNVYGHESFPIVMPVNTHTSMVNFNLMLKFKILIWN